MSVARILKEKPGWVRLYSLSTIARVYGSSPVEQPALQASKGLRRHVAAMFGKHCRGGEEIEVPRLAKEIGLVGGHHVDQMNQLLLRPSPKTGSRSTRGRSESRDLSIFA
jgi:hypothetical protein